MGRAPCCSKVGLHRGPWAPREDKSLINYIQAHGEGNWRSLPKQAGLLRCGKSCRLRWMNYLRPGIKRGNITPDEDDLIIRLHSFLGNRWSLIAGRLPGRTDNEIKNYWNTHLSKRLVSQGTHDPNTHKRLPAEQVQVQPVRKREGNPKNKRQKSKSEEPERPKIHLPKPGRIRSFYLPAAGNDSFNTLTPVWSSRRGEGGLGAGVTQVANTWSDDAGPELDRMIEFLGTYDDRDGAIRGSDFPSSDASLEKLYEEYLELLKTNN